jgi:hypothetical protein
MASAITHVASRFLVPKQQINPGAKSAQSDKLSVVAAPQHTRHKDNSSGTAAQGPHMLLCIFKTKALQ